MIFRRAYSIAYAVLRRNLREKYTVAPRSSPSTMRITMKSIIGVPPGFRLSIAWPTTVGISIWKNNPMNEINNEAMKIFLCAATMGKARLSHDLLVSGSMLRRGGGYFGTTPIGTYGDVTSSPNADWSIFFAARLVDPLVDPFVPAPLEPSPFGPSPFGPPLGENVAVICA